MLFNYDNFTRLEYKVRSLTQQVNLYQSGEKYTKLKAEYEKELRSKDAQSGSWKRNLRNPMHRQKKYSISGRRHVRMFIWKLRKSCRKKTEKSIGLRRESLNWKDKGTQQRTKYTTSR